MLRYGHVILYITGRSYRLHDRQKHQNGTKRQRLPWTITRVVPIEAPNDVLPI
jgi:hypothetical protein